MRRLYTVGASMALLSTFGLLVMADQKNADAAMVNSVAVADVNPVADAADTFEFVNVKPANGATVKSLSQVEFTLPLLDDTFETMPGPDEAKLEEGEVIKDGVTVATFIGPGEMMMDDDMNFIMPVMLSDVITEAGEYTISLPEGFFVQLGWDDDLDGFAPVPGGKVSAAYTATVTIDPNAKSIVDDFTLSPADGATVDEISVVYVNFPQISYGTMFDSWEFPYATFSNGEKSVDGVIGYDWNSEEEYLVMKITPVDSDEEPVTISENGEWTLSIEASTFILGGERSSEITAKYNVGEPAEPEVVEYEKVNPANGSTVKSLSEVEFTIPLLDEEYATLPVPDDAKFAEAKVTKDGQTIATFEELGEMWMEGQSSFVVPVILSEIITEAGEYTISVPEGFFIQAAWDDDSESYVPVKNGKISAAYSGTVNVDPAMKTAVDEYTLSPADGATVEEISVVSVSFPQIPFGSYFSNWEFPNATFTNGDETIEAVISYDWNNEEDYLVMNVTPVDSEEEPTTITTEGNWTLTIEAGTFTLKGDSNAEITASYVVNNQSGINGIEADGNGNVTVVSLDGKVVLNNVPASELTSLDKGIYVVNGKKVVIK